MVATTNSATAAEAELTALLVRHFNEHQQQAVAVVNDDAVVVGVKKDHHAVEARAKESMMQVEELMTRYALENLRTNNDNDDHDDQPSWDDILAKTLTRFLDCAMANTDSTDAKEGNSSMAAVDAILSLVAAVAAHCCFQKQKNKPKKNKHVAHTAQLVVVVVMKAVLQRTVEFSTVLLERVRCAACRCIGYIVQNLLVMGQHQQHQGGYDNQTLVGLLDTASQALVPRFIDKSQAVRLAAIYAAGCFFTSGNNNNHTMDMDMEDDPDLRTALTWALQHDASVVNRLAALQCLPVTVQTMPVLLSRLRDVKPKIRRTVLAILQNMSSSNSSCNFLTLLDASQCAGIVQAGLSDRDEEVQNETVKLICTTWMKTAKFNPITILQHLNVLEHEEACEKVIQVLLDADEETVLAEHLSDPEIRAYWQGIETATTSPVSSSSSQSPQLLDVHLVFFARIRCQYVQDIHQTAKNVTSARQAEAILQKVLPDVPVLCEIFQLHSAALISAVVAATGGGQSDDDDEIMDDTHGNGRRSSAAVSSSMTTREQEQHQDALTLTCLQLLQMACMTPWSEMEEGARLHLKQTMTTMLGSILTPDDLVEGCLVSLQAIHGNETDFFTCVSDIVHQLQRDEQAMMASSSGSISSDDEKDDDGLNDNRLLRILSILSILLEKVSLQVAVTCTAMLTDFASSIIVPAVTTTSGETNELVREAAVSCLGKLGLFTCESMVVRDFKPLLLNIVANEDETLEIRAQAMLALCDWSILFSDTLGPCPVVVADTANDDTNKSSTAVPLVAFPDLVFELMAHEELGMACVAAEVACKLLILGKICESSWLARLVTLFFDVRLNDDDEVMEDDNNDHSGHPDATTVAAASEVGSPVRLQQLLSLFFPAYSHKSEQNRHALVGAISMILDTLLAWHSQKKKRGAKAPVSVSKVLDYVVDTVHAADQTVQENLATKHMETTGGNEATTASQYSTPVLMAAIQMASFLSKEHANCKVLFLRTICKHLGLVATKNLQEAVEREKDRDLSVLMDLMQELDMEIADAACLKSLEPLTAVLDTIELDDDDASKVVVDDEQQEEEEDASSQEAGHGDDDEDEAESIVDALQTMAITPPSTVLDKENRSKDTRRVASTSSSGGLKRGGGSDRQRRQRCSNSSEGVLGNL